MLTMHMLHSLDAEVGRPASTVRNGFKWAGTEGQTVALCVCASPCSAPDHVEERDCVIEGTGFVLTNWLGRFKDIPARLLRFEHEERSRQYDGLLSSMRKAYGADFSESDFVTVVVYRRVA